MERNSGPPIGGTDRWFVTDGREKRGPLTTEELGALARSGALTPASLVWRPGFLEWKRAGDIPGLFSPPPLKTEPRAEISTATSVTPPPAPKEQAALKADRPAAPPARRASYVIRHWRGDLSLPVSYWINGGLSTIAAIAVAYGIGTLIKPEESQVVAAAGVTAVWAVIAAISVWQLVGIWRSAGKHKSRGGSGFWAGAARFMVGLGFLRLASMLLNEAGPSTIEYWRIVMGDPTMGPHQLRILRDGTELEYSGTITFGATDEVRKMLDADPAIRVIHLNSRGGRNAEARTLRDLIHERGLITYTSSGCASACTIAFMGGTQRFIADKAQLGFHRGAFPGLSDQDLAAENNVDRRWLVNNGVAPWFAERAYSTPNATVWIPTVAELRSANVITAVASASDFALSGITGLADREHADETLLKIPLFAVIHDAYPNTYTKMRDATVAAIRTGKSQVELTGIARPYVEKLLKDSLPYASDAAIVESTRVMVSELDQIGEKNPRDCYNYAFSPKGAPPVLIQQYVTQEIVNRDLASSAAVIQSASKAPRGRLPSEAEIKDSLNLVRQRLVAKFGSADVALLADPDKLSSIPGKGCALISSMFKEILTLPPAKQVALLRYLYAQPG